MRIVSLLTIVLATLIFAACAKSGAGTNVLPQTSAPERVTLRQKEIISRVGSRETILYEFSGGKDGSVPFGGLIRHADGTLYGTTSTGGGSSRCSGSSGSGCGTVFELVPSGLGYTETVLYRFKGGKDGAAPNAGLTDGGGGMLFGTTRAGGNSNCTAGCGTIFELTPSGSGYTKNIVHTFKGGADGASPLGALLADGSRVLYGTTEFGGNATCSIALGSGCGTVFKLVPTGSTYAKKTVYRFTYGPGGSNPYANLIVDGSGSLYGTTAYGGHAGCGYGCGTVFKLTPTSKGYSHRVLHSFEGGKDAQWPKAGLYADSSGALYGTTEGGGGTSCSLGRYLQGCGTIFKLTPVKGKYSASIIYRFQGAPDGALSYSSLVTDASGSFYGVTVYGGNGTCYQSYAPSGCGTVFKLTGSGTTYTENPVYSFKGGTDGATPFAGPILAKGSLYGTSASGGKCASPGCGTVYKVKP